MTFQTDRYVEQIEPTPACWTSCRASSTCVLALAAALHGVLLQLTPCHLVDLIPDKPDKA